METSPAGRWFPTEALTRAAREHGTPLYIYSAARIRDNVSRFRNAFPAADADLAFSVKACSNLAILRLLAAEGLLFDIVSGGELERLRRAGVTGERIVFAGVGKREPEIRAALETGIRAFNVESIGEAQRIARVATDMGTRAPVSLRFNPDVDAKSHHYISTGRGGDKFGLTADEIAQMGAEWDAKYSALELRGIHVHVGSQIREVDVWPEVVRVVDGLIESLPESLRAGLKSVNFGGGFAMDYGTGEIAIDLPGVAAVLQEFAIRRGLRIMVEPGRALVGNAGVLLTEVQFTKRRAGRNIAIIDAAMTELIRPALYSAHHRIMSLNSKPDAPQSETDIVGPVCETGDFLARGIPMPELVQGDLLAVLDAGAYGFTMSSNYNSRPRPAEVLIDGDDLGVIRRRETYDDLLRAEES